MPLLFDRQSILEKDFLFKSRKVSKNLGVRLSLQQLAAGGFLNENISKSFKVSIIIKNISKGFKVSIIISIIESALACFRLQI